MTAYRVVCRASGYFSSPYKTREQAEAKIESIRKAGSCSHDHEILTEDDMVDDDGSALG